MRGAGSIVQFAVTDAERQICQGPLPGILPDLFREGQGVVTEGAFDAGTHVFTADTVLAKHDENYMPKEVAADQACKASWKGAAGSEGRGQGSRKHQARETKATP